MNREIITTKDGSHTVAIPELQVTYHSHNGALQESMHVFIDAGLHWLIPPGASCPTGVLRILEMGFGTGLNTYLTALEAARLGQAIHYTAVEQFPLDPETACALNYANTPEEKALFQQLHHSPWHTDVAITPLLTLNKQQADLLTFQAPQRAHLLYYDAFAPRAQPELWTEAAFRKLHNMLLPGGTLVTYCSKSVVRRAMEAAGFLVTKIPGPRGKREMVRATTPAATPCPPKGGT